MKKLAILASLAAIFAGITGCQTAHIKTPEWEASINSHWFKRDVDKLSVQRQADGSYSVDLNGYKGDISDQLPAFTREFWAGVAILGRLAGSAVNPAVAAVPLTQEAASAADVEKLIKANAELRAKSLELETMRLELEKLKAESSKLQAEESTNCIDGSCGR